LSAACEARFFHCRPRLILSPGFDLLYVLRRPRVWNRTSFSASLIRARYGLVKAFARRPNVEKSGERSVVAFCTYS